MSDEDVRASEEARNLWREAKQQLNVYEEKSLELKLEYQKEQNTLQAAKVELSTAVQDAKDFCRRRSEAQSSKLTAQKHVLDMTQQSLAAAADTQRLTVQLAMERKEHQADKQRLEELRSQFQEHLDSTISHVQELKAFAQKSTRSQEGLTA